MRGSVNADGRQISCVAETNMASQNRHTVIMLLVLAVLS